MTSAQRTARKWELQIASDLGDYVISPKRPHYGVHAPDIIQVVNWQDMVTLDWLIVQKLAKGFGPLIGEAKCHSHGAVPKYIFDALDDPGAFEIDHQCPDWVAGYLGQALSFKSDIDPPLYFLAMRKKSGRGKGNGRREFVVVEADTFVRFFEIVPRKPFYQAVEWHGYCVIDYGQFVELCKDKLYGGLFK